MKRAISRHMFRGAVCALLVLGLTTILPAQNNSLFGNRGPLSQTGTTTQRNSGLAGSGLGTGGLGTGGLGTGGLGTGGLGGQQSANPLGTSAGATQLGQLSGTIGQGFVGRSDNVGRFVGERQAGQQNSQARRNFSGTGNTGRRGTGANNVNRNGGNQNGNRFGGNRSQMTIRPVQRVAFQYPRRSNTRISTALQGRLQRLAERRPQLQGISLTMSDQGEVVLRGEVDSESAKGLVANIIRLEPGVRKVRNELTVTPEP